MIYIILISSNKDEPCTMKLVSDGSSSFKHGFFRFGDLKLQNPDNRAFAQMFQKSYAGKILECHLNLLNVVRVGGYLPDRVTNLILQYLSNRWSGCLPWKFDAIVSPFKLMQLQISVYLLMDMHILL